MRPAPAYATCGTRRSNQQQRRRFRQARWQQVEVHADVFAARKTGDDDAAAPRGAARGQAVVVGGGVEEQGVGDQRVQVLAGVRAERGERLVVPAVEAEALVGGVRAAVAE